MFPKKMIYYFIFYIALGFIITVLQHIVLGGLPLKLNYLLWEDWIGGSVYIFLYIQLQRRILKSFAKEFKKEQTYLPMIVRYFVLVQFFGMLLMLGYSIIYTALLKSSLSIQFKDIEQLRFIFVYFFLIHTVFFIGGVALRLYELYNKEKDAKHQAEKSFLSAQLQLLRQQLNPHFLFNSLNIIASTINNKPKLAYDFTKSMASFYRKVLETENAGWISLKDEIKTISSYLYMLQVRFEDKLIYQIEIQETIQEKYSIPDFILQPIVENAVKHNIISKESPLKILINLNEEGRLIIRNSFNPKDAKAESIGVGWFNIENRYKYLGAKAPIKFVSEGWFIVEIPLIESEKIYS
ncbi:MAG: sensor histidine kinase [Sediminibacterium sp.]